MKPPRPPQPAEDRDARLKAALKANLARRTNGGAAEKKED